MSLLEAVFFYTVCIHIRSSVRLPRNESAGGARILLHPASVHTPTPLCTPLFGHFATADPCSHPRLYSQQGSRVGVNPATRYGTRHTRGDLPGARLLLRSRKPPATGLTRGSDLTCASLVPAPTSHHQPRLCPGAREPLHTLCTPFNHRGTCLFTPPRRAPSSSPAQACCTTRRGARRGPSWFEVAPTLCASIARWLRLNCPEARGSSTAPPTRALGSSEAPGGAAQAPRGQPKNEGPPRLTRRGPSRQRRRANGGATPAQQPMRGRLRGWWSAAGWREG
jgi:hypothetical protein